MHFFPVCGSRPGKPCNEVHYCNKTSKYLGNSSCVNIDLKFVLFPPVLQEYIGPCANREVHGRLNSTPQLLTRSPSVEITIVFESSLKKEG